MLSGCPLRNQAFRYEGQLYGFDGNGMPFSEGTLYINGLRTVFGDAAVLGGRSILLVS